MKFKNLFITFQTDHIKECVDFYDKYFLGKVTFDAGWFVMIQLDSEHSLFLSFQSNTDEIKRDSFAGGISLNLMVDDVDACYQQLKHAGVFFMEEIADHEWGDRAFSLHDPIGNLLYIYSKCPMHEKYKDAIKS